MIETLTQNIEFILAFIAIMSVPALVMVITAVLKKSAVYTPFIAMAVGAVFGLLGGWLAVVSIESIESTPLIVVTIIAGLVHGILSGASAVGIKVIADGEPEAETFDWED